ncbi:MAG: LacI family DNA-binding transcriptional regulator [Bacteroidales bacterium]|nr:LacI family DNA-binding transcriptional regulator [Bacteroidales bacterium]
MNALFVLVHEINAIFVANAIFKEMKGVDGKITIVDVARRAGVSKGTVDRVLHNRGEVSAASAEKVRKAVKELGYEPNLYASLLATRTPRMIALLLPRYESGEYWEKIAQGFDKGGAEAEALGIHVQKFLYDQYDPVSFDEAAAELLASQPSGVVLAPLFLRGSTKLVNALQSKDIPYVYVDSKLEDDGYFAYFGMPMYKSGYLCACLLTERCPVESVDEIAVVRIQRDRSRQSDPTVSRRAGFNDYITDHFPSCRIHNIFIDPSDKDSVDAILEAFFSEHPDIRFVVMFNSRIHLIRNYLGSHPLPARRVIGFDDLDKNLEMLKDGVVDILISQHSDMQSHRAVNTLADYIILHKKPQRRDNYMHMDILTRFNDENY